MQTSDDSTANVRANRFVLISARASCPHCGADTEVLAVGLPGEHQWRDEDAANAWYRASTTAVLFHLSHLTAPAAVAIAAHSTWFRPTRPPHDALWRNHCSVCRRPIDDDDLHCEPGGAFMPLGPEGVRFGLRFIEATFAAHAGGYAPEPPFYPHFTAA